MLAIALQVGDVVQAHREGQPMTVISVPRPGYALCAWRFDRVDQSAEFPAGMLRLIDEGISEAETSSERNADNRNRRALLLSKRRFR